MYVQLFHFIIFKHDITSVFLIILQKKYILRERNHAVVYKVVSGCVCTTKGYIDVLLSIGRL